MRRSVRLRLVVAALCGGWAAGATQLALAGGVPPSGGAPVVRVISTTPGVVATSPTSPVSVSATTAPTTPTTPVATTPPPQAGRRLGTARVPGAPTREGAWLARILLRTRAWVHPSPTARRLGPVGSVTPWGGPAQLLVLDVRWLGGYRWLKVRLSGRPNSRAAWITDVHVKLVRTAWRIEVSRARRQLVVLKAGEPVRTVPVVVGAPATPTPAGTFAIADELRQPDAGGFVGAWVLPLTARSNVLRNFAGGDGQVALHGRSGASLKDPVGSARSHGCLRMSNDSVAWIAAHVPTGTPVVVR